MTEIFLFFFAGIICKYLRSFKKFKSHLAQLEVFSVTIHEKKLQVNVVICCQNRLRSTTFELSQKYQFVLLPYSHQLIFVTGFFICAHTSIDDSSFKQCKSRALITIYCFIIISFFSIIETSKLNPAGDTSFARSANTL